MMPGSDLERRCATDVADTYRDTLGIPFRRPDERGYVSAPVLHFLWSRPWDNNALNWVASLRPSSVCVTDGEVKLNCKQWRVTVYLEDDSRTIKRIEQEVEVGLIGCSCGYDLQYGERA